MNIAYLGIKGLPARGGAERIVESIARRLSERHCVTVYCNQHYTNARIRFDPIRLIRLPSVPGKFTRMPTFDLIAAIHALGRGDYEVIHVHNLEASFVLPLLNLRYKTVATAHGRVTTRYNRKSRNGRPQIQVAARSRGARTRRAKCARL